MRQMQLKENGKVIYQSFFDESSGLTLRRTIDILSYTGEIEEDNFIRNLRFRAIRSPSPELLDIAITNYCDYGCKYCYQDSTTKQPHGPKELVERILTGFKYMPYQIAIGGGEPTLHPHFCYILEKARELGTIPNYTTAGHHLTEEIIDVTNNVCGGVALTYHQPRGLKTFRKLFENAYSKLNCQINIHVIADKNVITALDDMIELKKSFEKINVVLLAYYPLVGRASINDLITRTTYTKYLPDKIKEALNAGIKIAFSEGLIGYFMSRPEIGVNAKHACLSEGLFSGYFDWKGQLFTSSFEASKEDLPQNVWNTDSQTLWDNIDVDYFPSNGICNNCEYKNRCGPKNTFHLSLCAKQKVNQLPLKGDRA